MEQFSNHIVNSALSKYSSSPRGFEKRYPSNYDIFTPEEQEKYRSKSVLQRVKQGKLVKLGTIEETNKKPKFMVPGAAYID